MLTHIRAQLYRSCGNCGTQYKRTFIASGVVAVDGSTLAGINTNYGGEASPLPPPASLIAKKKR